MSRQNFNVAAGRWVEQERVRARNLASDSSLVEQLVGDPQDAATYRRTLRQQLAPQSALGGIQSQLLRVTNQPNGVAELFDNTLSASGLRLQAVSARLVELGADLDVLFRMYQDTPPRISSKEEALLISDLTDRVTQAQAARDELSRRSGQDIAALQIADRIAQLADANKLPQGEIDAFLATTSIAGQDLSADRIQVVRELDDRVWSVSSRPPGPASTRSQVQRQVAQAGSLSPTSGVQTSSVQTSGVQTSGGITAVAGTEGAVSLVDGQMSFSSPQGLRQVELVRLQLEVKQAVARVASAKRKSNQMMAQAVEATGTIAQQMRFHLWACLVLDVAENIERSWGEVRQIILAIMIAIDQLKRAAIGAMITAASPSVSRWQGVTRDIQLVVGGLGDNFFEVSQLLGVQASLSNSDIVSQGNNIGGVCAQVRAQHCQISAGLRDLDASIREALNVGSISLGGLTSADVEAALGWNPQVVVNAAALSMRAVLDQADLISPLIGSLQLEACAWVRGGIKGRSKKITSILGALGVLVGAIAIAATGINPATYGITSDGGLLALTRQARAMGFDALVNDLEGGDLGRAMSRSDSDVTSSGEVSMHLRDVSRRAQGTNLSLRAADLSDVAARRNRQVLAEQNIRSSAKGRFYTNTSLVNAQFVEREGDKIMQEVDRESKAR